MASVMAEKLQQVASAKETTDIQIPVGVVYDEESSINLS